MLKFANSEALDAKVNVNNMQALKSVVCLKVNDFQAETLNILNPVLHPIGS